MAFTLEGDYFDECTCKISCPCIFLNEATEDLCDGVFAWHIVRGDKDGLDLSNLNVAMAWHSGKQMQDGDWRVAMYIDERAARFAPRLASANCSSSRRARYSSRTSPIPTLPTSR